MGGVSLRKGGHEHPTVQWGQLTGLARSTLTALTRLADLSILTGSTGLALAALAGGTGFAFDRGSGLVVSQDGLGRDGALLVEGHADGRA